MRPRVYEVDDEDYSAYKDSGGTLTEAEFYNHRLSSSPHSSLTKRLADSLGTPHQQPASLIERIKQTLV